MTDLRPLKAREVIRALEHAGFEQIRHTSSHVIMYKPGLSRPVPIPMHGKDIRVSLLRRIINQAGMTVEEFLEYAGRRP
jgi:predicted RNA binding protein YcfA (HicA-like mRNA interferase family)